MPTQFTINIEGTGMLEPQDAWHLAEGDGIPGRLYFRLDRGADGRWFCAEIRLAGDRPITTSALRSLPLTRIVEEFLRHSFPPYERGGPVDPVTGVREWYDGSIDGPSMTGAQFLDSSVLDESRVSSAQKPRRGGAAPTLDDLRTFAEVYKQALISDPRRAMAATLAYLDGHGWPLSRSTAFNYRKAAAERGLLELAD